MARKPTKTMTAVKATRVAYKEKGGEEELTMQDIGRTLTFDRPHATVRVSQGVTLNMGNYQSMRLAVDISLPCIPEDCDAAYVTASKFVEAHLTELISEVKGQKKEEDGDAREDFDL